jgi:hypothetical protein
MSAPAAKLCDKFTAVPATRPNLSQSFPPTGNKCNEFGERLAIGPGQTGPNTRSV